MILFFNQEGNEIEFQSPPVCVVREAIHRIITLRSSSPEQLGSRGKKAASDLLSKCVSNQAEGGWFTVTLPESLTDLEQCLMESYCSFTYMVYNPKTKETLFETSFLLLFIKFFEFRNEKELKDIDQDCLVSKVNYDSGVGVSKTCVKDLINALLEAKEAATYAEKE